MLTYVTEQKREGSDLQIPASLFHVSRGELERKGRTQALVRSLGVAVLLFLLQQPPYQVAQGDLPEIGTIPAYVPARISLLIDVAMIAAYLLAGYRALELVRATRPTQTVRRVMYAAMFVLAVGGVADLAENLGLWRRMMGVPGTDQTVDMTYDWSWVMVGLVVGALVVLTGLAFWHRNELGKDAPAEPSPTASTGGSVICCSGGGMRSASFCLGGLQVLTDEGKYQTADAVIGVSGGGYIAAAYHTVRWRSTEADAPDDTGPGEWPSLEELPAFAPNSPEQRWLRRNSRALLDSTNVALLAVLSLLYGIAINIVLIAAALAASAAYLAWYLVASGGLRSWNFQEAEALNFADGFLWNCVEWVWLVPAAGAGLFVLEKAIDRWATLSFGWRDAMRAWSARFILSGGVATALLLGVPVILESLHDFTTDSASPTARLIHALGLIPDSACTAALASGPGCGVELVDDVGDGTTATALSAGSLAAVLAAVTAVVRAARSNLTESPTAGEPTRWRRLAGSLWAKVKNVVVPWVAAILVVGVVVFLLLRWISELVQHPSSLERWDVVFWLGLALLLIRLFTETNRTSLHHFYRERISAAFLVRRRHGVVEPVGYRAPLRFSESVPPNGQGPHLVSCAVANVSDPGLVPAKRGCTPFVFDGHRIGLTDPLLPWGSALAPSRLYEYVADRRHRDATVPAALAMSGAAFSPLAGRENVRVGPFRMVLALANARLGVWLPNPLWIDEVSVLQRLVQVRSPEAAAAWGQLSDDDHEELLSHLTKWDKAWLYDQLDDGGTSVPFPRPTVAGRERDGRAAEHNAEARGPLGRWVVKAVEWVRRDGFKLVEVLRGDVAKPGPYRLLKEAVGQPSIYDRSLYITDGGHYDNLGLIEALRRKPDRIYVLDASADPEDTFRALGLAIATARMDLDCEVTFDPRVMRRMKQERSEAAWGIGDYKFADVNGERGAAGKIYLAKVVMVNELPWDVETYAATNPEFPRTSTVNQLYGEFDLESYRVLGREVTRKLLNHIDREEQDWPRQAPERLSPHNGERSKSSV
jgi:hypothetical protein